MNAIQYFDWGWGSISTFLINLFARYTNPRYREIYILSFDVTRQEGGRLYDSRREWTPPYIGNIPGKIKLGDEKTNYRYCIDDTPCSF